MMYSNVKKTSIALAIISSLLFNGASFAFMQTAEAAKQAPVVSEYDPFADEEDVKAQTVEENKKLTFKERLAKMKAEEQKNSQSMTLDNVMPGHIYIPKKTILIILPILSFILPIQTKIKVIKPPIIYKNGRFLWAVNDIKNSPKNISK